MSLTIALLLDQEIAAVNEFIKILQDEHEALKHGPADRLSVFGEQKLALVAQLNMLESQRDLLLGKTDGDSTAERMNNWLATAKNAGQITPRWHQLLDLARKARRLHQLNAEILSQLLERTTEAINILTLRQKEISLYGSDGQAACATGSRIVDSA